MGSYRLSVMPSEASVDINRESSGEINSGDTQTSCEGFEYQIPCFACHSHLHFNLSLSTRNQKPKGFL